MPFHNLIHFIFMLALLIAIVFTCSLFTNAIEHLGRSLKLGNNAIGGILAVFGTSLPEAIVPIVAISAAFIFKTDLNVAQDIALGAIMGSPFMLTTLALFLLGVSLIIFQVFKKRKKKELFIKSKNVLRELKYFIFAYSLALLAGITPVKTFKIFIAIFILILYFVFVYRTIVKSKENFVESQLDDLIFAKFLKLKKETVFLTFFQILVSLAALIIFSHLFVDEIKNLSYLFNFNPVILSLVITPFATELPETVNSIIWVKASKDDLAISNILGAVVFQATVLCFIGIMLLDWVFDKTIILNSIFVLICTMLLYVSILFFKRLKLSMLLFCGLFYFAYLLSIKFL